MGYSFRLAARDLLYASSHRQDNTYHGLCYTSLNTHIKQKSWAQLGSVKVDVGSYLPVFLISGSSTTTGGEDCNQRTAYFTLGKRVIITMTSGADVKKRRMNATMAARVVVEANAAYFDITTASVYTSGPGNKSS